MRIVLVVLIYAMLGGVATSVHASSDLPWLKKTYDRFSNNDSVRNFLEKMCASLGIPSVISDRVKGSISGSFKGKTVNEVLDIMNHVYSVVWYFDGANLYFYHANEVSMTLMDFNGTEAEFVKRQLEQAGIWDNRFRWRSVDGYSAAYVSGPQRLKDLINEFVGLINVKRGETDKLLREGVVVPLKYVRAEDENVSLDGQGEKIPGLVSTLRDLVYDRKVAEIKERFSDEESSADQERALDTLKSSLTRGIKAHANQNAVVLLDTPENIALYRNLITQLDVPSEQVEIDVTIIDVLTDKINELGFDWQSVGNTGALSLSEGLTADLIRSSDGIAELASTFASPEDIFRLRLEALEADGEANILSQPSVVTLNNVPASIDNTETFFVKLEGDEAVSLEQVVVGSRLIVTPRIMKEGEERNVHLDIYLEDGQRTGDDVGDLPTIRQTKITTKSVVKSHGSLLVGGYYVERKQISNVGVPILKDIPLVGRIFRSERQSKVKLVRMFLLTPKVKVPSLDVAKRAIVVDRLSREKEGVIGEQIERRSMIGEEIKKTTASQVEQQTRIASEKDQIKSNYDNQAQAINEADIATEADFSVFDEEVTEH